LGGEGGIGREVKRYGWEEWGRGRVRRRGEGKGR
jgi:hypothetical protein